MTEIEQVEDILSKLEDDVSDLNEDAAIFVSEAREKILAIVALLETKIEQNKKLHAEIKRLVGDE